MIDAGLLHVPQNFGVSNIFSNRFDFHRMATLVDGCDHGANDRIGRHSKHEAAVDLQEIHKQVLQLAE